MVEYFWCGRRFPELYRLTVEDVQREHLPENAFQTACTECLCKIRATSNLVPEQQLWQSIINLAWMVPVFSIALFASAMLVSMGAVPGNDPQFETGQCCHIDHVRRNSDRPTL